MSDKVKRCNGRTKKGSRCRRPRKYGHYCGPHAEQKENESNTYYVAVQVCHSIDLSLMERQMKGWGIRHDGHDFAIGLGVRGRCLDETEFFVVPKQFYQEFAELMRKTFGTKIGRIIGRS